MEKIESVSLELRWWGFFVYSWTVS